MIKKSQKYCYLTPRFPKKAYAVLLFLVDKKKVFMHATPSIYKNLDDLSSGVTMLADYTLKKQKVLIPKLCILLPIRFETHYQLKPEYWNNPTQSFNPLDRLYLYLKMLDKHPLYKLLVTPSGQDAKNDWQFRAALPFLESTDPKALEQFMLTSDFPVDQKAKYAAVYQFARPVMKYNWQTKEPQKSKAIIPNHLWQQKTTIN